MPLRILFARHGPAGRWTELVYCVRIRGNKSENKLVDLKFQLNTYWTFYAYTHFKQCTRYNRIVRMF